MIPRLGLDLEPGLQLSRTLPDLDLLDIAYGAVHGGAQAIMVPISAFVSSLVAPELFVRGGIPLFAVKSSLDDLDRVPALGSGPDRIVVMEDRNRPVSDFARLADLLSRVAGQSQESGVLIEPEPAGLKELSRMHVKWAFFSTETLFNVPLPDAAEAEMARLTSAAAAANRLRMRVAMIGPTGRHLPATLAAIPFLEELYPATDLWSMALRLGWEGAVSEYCRLLR
jgi:hypothetical protein